MAFWRKGDSDAAKIQRRQEQHVPKVTMSLTERDAANTEMLHRVLDARSNAHAVSIALSLTAFLATEIQKGNDILLRDPNGDLQKLVMTELAPLRHAAA